MGPPKVRRRLSSETARPGCDSELPGVEREDPLLRSRGARVERDERFTPDAEDAPGQATCEGGEHLPLIGLVAAVLARAIQDFVRSGIRRDAMVSLGAVTPTTV
jgi:hypothetical protein